MSGPHLSEEGVFHTHSRRHTMIIVTIALGSLALWGVVASARSLRCDGYRAVPTRSR